MQNEIVDSVMGMALELKDLKLFPFIARSILNNSKRKDFAKLVQQMEFGEERGYRIQ